MAFDPPDKEFEEAVTGHDGQKICLWLNQGMNPAKSVGAGAETLLHLAAAWGDATLCATLLSFGVDVFIRNKWGETPEEVAIHHGFDGIASDLRSWATPLSGGAFAEQTFVSIEALRAACRAEERNYFYEFAASGNFKTVIDLAQKGDGLKASDLLEKVAGGNSTLLRLCQSGQLGSILKTEIWVGRPEDFRQVWSRVPRDYHEDFDVEAFIRQLQLEKVQSGKKFRLGPG